MRARLLIGISSIIICYQGCNSFNAVLDDETFSLQSIDQTIDADNSKYKIPQQCLSYKVTESMPSARRLTKFEYFSIIEDVFAAETKSLEDDFPDDPRSSGFLNHEGSLAISRDHIRAFSKLADKVVDSIPQFENFLKQTFSPCTDKTAGCFRSFAKVAAERFYRRPASTVELDALNGIYTIVVDNEGGGFLEAAKTTLKLLLQSPLFLYRLEEVSESGGLTSSKPLEMASRISFLVWQSLPDNELLNDAKTGDLLSNEKINYHIRRMLKSPKARRALRNYVSNWLHLELVGKIDLTAGKYPNLDFELIEDMKKQTLKHFEELVFTEKRSLLDAFTDRHTYLNEKLGTIYGLNLQGSQLRRVDVSALAGRRGILSNPSVLMAPLKSDNPSIVQRGVFFNETIACQVVAPPPPDVADNALVPVAGTSQRDHLQAHRQNRACASCHNQLDGPGLAFDIFNTIGAFRQNDEKGNQLRADGEWHMSEKTVRFNNTDGLMEQLVAIQSTQFCMAKNVFQFSIGRELEMSDTCEVWSLMDDFRQSKFNYEELLIKVATTQTFRWSSNDQ